LFAGTKLILYSTVSCLFLFPYSYFRIVGLRNVRYKVKISGVNPRPGKQASAVRYQAVAHSLSSTALEQLVN